ncbi:MAG: bifunctional adenosylcobinamide kinase/adenosylcobinamide-phosphate guanylyltransferase [Bryobacterales bacterium]|nr:bifunctional adenosylcobinamide kinase/adenosylcobinamide-phosphate guanylyltransferase [Bryobacterales bacterium]
MALILVGGGARSGKSRHALALARERGSNLAFVATAQALDAEMEERIARHRAERDPSFTTFEEPLDVAELLERIGGSFDAILVDCLTLWVSNHLLAGSDPEALGGDLVAAAAGAPAAVILVTNETGCGIVPENALARRFRDAAGNVNQAAATRAIEVYWMVFGVPLRVK